MGPPPAPSPVRRCAVCGSAAVVLLCAAETIGRDLGQARRGLDGFLHDDARAVYRCESCGSAFRDPPSGAGPTTSPGTRAAATAGDTLDQLRREGGGRARSRRRPPPGARRGRWRPAAGDRLLRRGVPRVRPRGGLPRHGHRRQRRRRGPLRRAGTRRPLRAVRPARFGAGEFDGVWILNCFEQLPDPRACSRARRAPAPRRDPRDPDAQRGVPPSALRDAGRRAPAPGRERERAPGGAHAKRRPPPSRGPSRPTASRRAGGGQRVLVPGGGERPAPPRPWLEVTAGARADGRGYLTAPARSPGRRSAGRRRRARAGSPAR